MEEIKENQQIVYNYDWKYELFQNIKRILIWLLKIGVILFVLIMLLKYAPMWLFSMVLGAVIFSVPAWLFVKSFFKVDYMIFLVVDLEKKEITPYFIPSKLIKDGIWEIVGVKTKYKSRSDVISDQEIDRIFKEIEEIDFKILKYEDRLKKLKEELKLLRVKRKKKLWKVGKVDKLFLKLGLVNLAKAVNPDACLETLESYEKSIYKIKDEINELTYKIQELKAEKNNMLLELEWIGEFGESVFLSDKIDKKSKKIYLSPLHSCSDLELQLNKHKFAELKAYIKELTVKYAKMKIDYEDKVYDAAISLIEEIEKETYNIDNIDEEKGEENVRN